MSSTARWPAVLASALDKRSALFWAAASTTLVVLLGAGDLLTGYELSFSLFYLAPISLVAWYAGRELGLLISTFSAVAWFLADYASGHVYSSPVFYLWNTLVRFSIFVIVTLLLSALRAALKTEQALVRVDYVTGAASARYFQALAQAEFDRARRYGHATSLAYLDLDHFKTVNDVYEHSTLMYSVKHAGRNSVTYAAYPDDCPEPKSE